MNYVTRAFKGEYQYIKRQSIFEIVKTVLLFAMALGIFFIGYYTLGTKKSLWSVLAVLALLPASKSMVGMIMLLRFRSVSDQLYKRVNEIKGNVPTLFEMVFTTSQKAYYSPALCYAKGSLIVLVDADKNKCAELEKHLSDVLKNAGHKNVVVKAYDREDDFLNRVADIREHFGDEETISFDAVFNTLKAVAL